MDFLTTHFVLTELPACLWFPKIERWYFSKFVRVDVLFLQLDNFQAQHNQSYLSTNSDKNLVQLQMLFFVPTGQIFRNSIINSLKYVYAGQKITFLTFLRWILLFCGKIKYNNIKLN